MEFRILGPLEAGDASGAVKLAAGKQKALLARLLLDADRVVSSERLVDELWGEDVPVTAQKMVQILVSQLRKLLPEGSLRTQPPGYRLDLDGHVLDLRRFEELTAAGRAALARGAAVEAAPLLREALVLWRGPALAEFEEPFAHVESARLEELRVACLEQRLEAELALGLHAETVAELETLVRRHPQRERLREQLMLALYRSGRQTEALESYQAFRRMLDEGVGIDPSLRLKDLERRILQQDPSLAAEPAPRPRVAAAAVAAAPAGRAAESPPGRERELGHLDRLLREAGAGERKVVFVSGDPGIGKSTIVDAFVAPVAAAGHALVAHGQCVEHRGAGEPYLPVLEALGRLLRRPAGAPLLPLLARQAPTWIGQMPWLLPDDELEAVQRRLVGATHERMLREMLEALETVSEERPVVLVLEDLHWSDPSTLDLLDALARRREQARLLVVGTFRRADGLPRPHPVHGLARGLRSMGLSVEIAVGPLGEEAVEEYLAARLGAAPPAGVASVLRERTGGSPLFVKTLLDSWIEQGLLEDRGDGAPDLAALARDVPDSVRELIEQMLEQLDPADQALLAAASVVGQELAAAAVAAAAEQPEADVEERCDALARAGRFLEQTGEQVWPDGTVTARFRFAHDLHRDVIHDRLTPRRRGELHGRVGRRLEAAFGPAARDIAAELAEHFVAAGDAARAVVALRLAAEQALERLAHREALEHVTVGLQLVERLPDGAGRWPDELALQSMLGASLIATRGWSDADAEAAFLHARALADRLERDDDIGRALFRLGTLYEVRGEYERSEVLLEETLARSGSTASSGLMIDSHELLACSLFHQGDFDAALDHAERGLAVYDGSYVNPVTAAYGDNSGAACHTWAALSLWFLGYPDRARERARVAVELTDDPRRRHGRATALAHATIVDQLRRDARATYDTAGAAIEVARHDGYLYRLAMAVVLRGWALAALGSCDEGITEIGRGLALSAETGAFMDEPYYRVLLADAYARAGRHAEALGMLEPAPSGRRFFFESEVHRLAGEVLAAAGRNDEAEARSRLALELAREQGSPSLELRAAIGLARILDGRGNLDAVAAAYARFSEGFETPDLLDARAILE
jgi:DNA-binding SARP family transcriptional activator